MHEYVLPGIIGDKAKPLFVIEPLNFTTCHIISPEGCLMLFRKSWLEQTLPSMSMAYWDLNRGN